jgi:uncharacterized membrane protein YjgN (DUF898 family)
MSPLYETKSRGLDLAGIVLVNFFLSVLTFGLYHFWARTRVRRYIWSTTRVDGDALTYSGTGLELCLGFLAGLLFLSIPALVIGALVLLVSSADESSAAFLVAVAIPVVFVLRPFVQYRALRYTASRTTLKGIRFSLEGSATSYAIRHGVLLGSVLLTGGLLYPWLQAVCWRTKVNNAQFGTATCTSTTSARDLFLLWIVCLLLLVPTLGLSFLYYRAYETLYFLRTTSIQGVQIECVATPFDVVVLKVTSWLLLAITFGLASPFVSTRQLRQWSNWMFTSHEINYSLVRQSTSPSPSIGDGLLASEFAL